MSPKVESLRSMRQHGSGRGGGKLFSFYIRVNPVDPTNPSIGGFQNQIVGLGLGKNWHSFLKGKPARGISVIQ